MLPEALLGGIVWVAGALAVVALADAGRRALHAAAPRDQWMWALATVVLLLARQWTVTMPGGPSLQYVGAAWLTLLLGYPRAVVSVAAVVLAQTTFGARAVTALPIEIILFGVAPAWLMATLASACRRWLPPNLFVFLIGVGFLGLFVAYALPLLAAAALGTFSLAVGNGASAGARDAAAAHALAQYTQTALPYALLLAAGEAWLEGMLTTALVVFAPGTVRLFDEAHYLAQR